MGEDYQLTDELATGRFYGVFIDDTGSPGLKNTPRTLHPDRKTWVSVIVPPEQMADVMANFPPALWELEARTGATEFHWEHIFAGTHDFERTDLNTRLALFGFMAEVFRTYKFPIIVQTLDPKTHARLLESKPPMRDQLGRFNLRHVEDFALLMLLWKVTEYLEKNRSQKDTLATVFVDSGFLPHGKSILVPDWKDYFSRGKIYFADSTSILPIQLADFAAFGTNRTQLAIGRRKFKRADAALIEIMSSIAFNYQNLYLVDGEMRGTDDGQFEFRIKGDHVGSL